MREQDIHFSCRCGRRLTAVIHSRPSSIRFLDHGVPLEGRKCSTPGCERDYGRLTVDEFKDHVFCGY